MNSLFCLKLSKTKNLGSELQTPISSQWVKYLSNAIQLATLWSWQVPIPVLPIRVIFKCNAQQCCQAQRHSVQKQYLKETPSYLCLSFGEEIWPKKKSTRMVTGSRIHSRFLLLTFHLPLGKSLSIPFNLSFLKGRENAPARFYPSILYLEVFNYRKVRIQQIHIFFTSIDQQQTS